MLELLKEQLTDYLTEYKQVNKEINQLFEKSKFKPEELEALSKKGAGLKMMIGATIKEMKQYA